MGPLFTALLARSSNPRARAMHEARVNRLAAEAGLDPETFLAREYAETARRQEIARLRHDAAAQRAAIARVVAAKGGFITWKEAV